MKNRALNIVISITSLVLSAASYSAPSSVGLKAVKGCEFSLNYYSKDDKERVDFIDHISERDGKYMVVCNAVVKSVLVSLINHPNTRLKEDYVCIPGELGEVNLENVITVLLPEILSMDTALKNEKHFDVPYLITESMYSILPKAFPCS